MSTCIVISRANNNDIMAITCIIYMYVSVGDCWVLYVSTFCAYCLWVLSMGTVCGYVV